MKLFAGKQGSPSAAAQLDDCNAGVQAQIVGLALCLYSRLRKGTSSWGICSWCVSKQPCSLAMAIAGHWQCLSKGTERVKTPTHLQAAGEAHLHPPARAAVACKAADAQHEGGSNHPAVRLRLLGLGLSRRLDALSSAGYGTALVRHRQMQLQVGHGGEAADSSPVAQSANAHWLSSACQPVRIKSNANLKPEGFVTEESVLQGVDVGHDVEFEKIAARAAGYSGDDLTNVCRDAALNGMRRKIAGLSPTQIRCLILPCSMWRPKAAQLSLLLASLIQMSASGSVWSMMLVRHGHLPRP